MLVYGHANKCAHMKNYNLNICRQIHKSRKSIDKKPKLLQKGKDIASDYLDKKLSFLCKFMMK